MKKLLSSILVLLVLSAVAAVLVIRYPQWNPLGTAPSPQVSAPKADVLAEYKALTDSLDQLDLLIRNESDPRLQQLNKDRQRYFRERATALRASVDSTISEAAPTKSKSSTPIFLDEEMTGLLKAVGSVVAVTAAVLIFVILAVWILLRRRKTKRSLAVQAANADRFRAPKGGYKDYDDAERTRVERPRPPAPAPDTDPEATIALPDTRTIEATATPQPATKSGPRERITRITKAIKGLAEALSTLKPPQAQESPSSGKPKVRARSQNILDPTVTDDASLPQRPEAMEPSRFDKEREEKEDILKLSRRGFTSSEIARRLRIPQDRVDLVIRLQRDQG